MASKPQFCLSDQICLVRPTTQHLLVFFHGLGATKEDLVPVYEHILKTTPQSQSLGALFVQAPIQSCQLLGGAQAPCWFDANSLENLLSNQWQGLDECIQALISLIKEVRRLYPHIEELSFIGFSQGGAVCQRLAEKVSCRCVILLSTFAVSPLGKLQTSKVLVCHGYLDNIVFIVHGRSLCQTIRKQEPHLSVDYREYPYLDHSICEEELNDISHFL